MPDPESLPPPPGAGSILCRLDDIADPGGKGFEYADPDSDPDGSWGHRFRVVVVRRGAEVFGYRNACPHMGVPLEWMPDSFLTLDRQRIRCALHGAEFEIGSGYCLSGPCAGRSLAAFPVSLENGVIVVGSARSQG